MQFCKQYRNMLELPTAFYPTILFHFPPPYFSLFFSPCLSPPLVFLFFSPPQVSSPLCLFIYHLLTCSSPSVSLQFMVWAPSPCSSSLTCPPPAEGKVELPWPPTDPWSEHAQSLRPTATHLSLYTPAVTHTSSTSWPNNTTRARWRGSSRMHTWARWENTSMLHTNKQTHTDSGRSLRGLFFIWIPKEALRGMQESFFLLVIHFVILFFLSSLKTRFLFIIIFA